MGRERGGGMTSLITKARCWTCHALIQPVLASCGCWRCPKCESHIEVYEK